MSSHNTLYRKYRPGDFEQVLGQEHVVSVLKAAVEQSKINHAYLFAGSRGTGKTSVARILAKSLGVSNRDLIEVDGASNRKIDEVRELQESARSLPFESPWKVYIIDEVHMLTNEAFNALLKTLEEPPSHVIFILATTESHKVPETIISRCEVYTFNKPTGAVLENLIKQVAKKEGVTLASGVPQLLAALGDGSFRDTLGLLQKVITLSADRNIELEEVEVIVGAPGRETVREFIAGLLDADLGRVLSVTDRLTEAGTDYRIFLSLVLRQLRLVTFLNLTPERKQVVLKEVDETEAEALTGLAQKPTARFLPAVIKEFLQSGELMDHAALPQLPVELAAIKVIDQLKDKV